MKNKIFTLICSGVCFLSILLTTEHFRFLPLTPFAIEKLPFVKEEKGISIAAKAYTRKESKTFLQRDLVSRGYRPIQVFIQNNSPSSFHLKLESLKKQKVPTHKIAKKVMQDALPRSIGLKIASFLFWPFAIPSAIDSIYTFKTYQELKKDYQAKELREELIPPYSTINRILFVKARVLKDAMTLKLIDVHTGEEIAYLTTISS